MLVAGGGFGYWLVEQLGTGAFGIEIRLAGGISNAISSVCWVSL